MRRNFIKSFLAVGDYALLVVSLLIVLWLRYGQPFVAEQFLRHVTSFSGIFAAWIVVFYVFNLYSINTPFNHRHYIAATAVNVGLAVAIFYAFPVLDITPKTNLALIVGVFTLLYYPWRFGMNRTIDRLGFAQPLAIVGADPETWDLIEMVQRKRREGFRLAVLLMEESDPVRPGLVVDGLEIVHSVDAFKATIRAQAIQTVVISNSWYGRVYSELYELIGQRVRFYKLSSFWEAFDETIPVYGTDESWFLESLNHNPVRAYSLMKRVLDVVVAILVLPIVIPLMLLTALAVLATSRGPVIYRQTRVGRSEKPFTLLKFRSMVQNAESAGAQWATENDPRTTPIGGFLRRVRLDELPQIFNIVRGDMSWIGPRPERPVFVDQLARKVPHYQLRHLVKPGLTGWAQVRYRYAATEADAATKLMFDLYYVKNFSFVMDAKIVLKTILIIVTGGGR